MIIEIPEGIFTFTVHKKFLPLKTKRIVIYRSYDSYVPKEIIDINQDKAHLVLLSYNNRISKCTQNVRNIIICTIPKEHIKYINTRYYIERSNI